MAQDRFTWFPLLLLQTFSVGTPHHHFPLQTPVSGHMPLTPTAPYTSDLEQIAPYTIIVCLVLSLPDRELWEVVDYSFLSTVPGMLWALNKYLLLSFPPFSVSSALTTSATVSSSQTHRQHPQALHSLFMTLSGSPFLSTQKKLFQAHAMKCHFTIFDRKQREA